MDKSDDTKRQGPIDSVTISDTTPATLYTKSSLPPTTVGGISDQIGLYPHRTFLETYEDLVLANNPLAIRTFLYDTFSCVKRIYTCLTVDSDSRFTAGLVDLEWLQTWYAKTAEHVDTTYVSAITTLLDHIKHGIQTIRGGDTSVLLIIMQNPVFLNVASLSNIMPKLCYVIATLTQQQRMEFAWSVQESIIQGLPSKPARAHQFQQLVGIIQQFITLRILSMDSETYVASQDDAIAWATQTLGIFSSINDANDFIPYYEFYNQAIEETLDLKEEYPRWKSRDGFSFCAHPYILSAAVKGDILKIESMVHMRHELQDSFFRAMFIGVNSPYLQLEVRREHLIRDALFQLAGKTLHDLKKQLRITFVGEEGIDEGGVQKEFFQILIREIFSPDYGMFKFNDESRLCWFAYTNSAPDPQMIEEFGLIGQMVGLAIFNGVVLDIHFPLALYKKLLNYPLTLDDLAELDPQLARGLEQLLAFDGDVEETYGRMFTAELEDATGKRFSHDLHEGGSERAVTAENRQEFVDLLIDFLLVKSVAAQYEAFSDGFSMVTEGSAMPLFRGEELRELICGSPTLDFEALEEGAQYDGYTKDSPTIRHFWEVVHAMTEEQKKLLLFFTTGSDRVPIGGLSKLTFIVARNGTDSDRVPTSHTCYNVLLLPEYSTKEKLYDRLLTALSNSNCGFFLN